MPSEAVFRSPLRWAKALRGECHRRRCVEAHSVRLGAGVVCGSEGGLGFDTALAHLSHPAAGWRCRYSPPRHVGLRDYSPHAAKAADQPKARRSDSTPNTAIAIRTIAVTLIHV